MTTSLTSSISDIPLKPSESSTTYLVISAPPSSFGGSDVLKKQPQINHIFLSWFLMLLFGQLMWNKLTKHYKLLKAAFSLNISSTIIFIISNIEGFMIEIRGGDRKCSPHAILKLVGRTLPLMTGLQGLLGLSGLVISSTTWLGLLLPSELYAATWRQTRTEKVIIYSSQSRARLPVCSQWMHRCEVHLVSDKQHGLNATTKGGMTEWRMICW